ncbi:hypothetical protein E3N88_17805 [Mikania micrantha]|uniref:Uncharacterized protein n=1 Tax=Mikania micrantha TaxID=192012 RepID=A0A5N6NU88_9ASTR|nr:hypothetical protein E3N88_17805 [Mikania micrantha]
MDNVESRFTCLAISYSHQTSKTCKQLDDIDNESDVRGRPCHESAFMYCRRLTSTYRKIRELKKCGIGIVETETYIKANFQLLYVVGDVVNAFAPATYVIALNLLPFNDTMDVW